jgi:trehalose 6-phosphate phosphatase
MIRPEDMERIRAIASGPRPLLVATDLDGTLSPIVERASAARVPEPTLAVLDRLTSVANVAVITGRDLNTARRLVPCEGVIMVGSHGLEISLDSTTLMDLDRAALAAALEQAEQQVITAVPSAFLHIERKAISTAFHFRRAPELEPALRRALAKLPKGLKLREGRMVLEVLPDAGGGKDRALAALARHLRARSLMVMGDDATDVAMFRAALALRSEGASVLVCGVSGGPETPREIRELSDIMLESTDEALEALEILARSLGA